MVQLHAGGTEDGAQGPRRAALFSDDLADVLVCNAQTDDRGAVVIDHLDGDLSG